MYEKDQIIEFDISSYGASGEGVALAGMPVFIPGAMMGERVRARIVQAKPAFAKGELIEVLSPSPSRVKPLCPYFENGCGGCELMHMTYEETLFAKENAVRNALAHIGGVDVDNCDFMPILASPNDVHYRNKAVYHCGREGNVGFYGKKGHEIRSGKCQLQSKEAETVRGIVEKALREKRLESIRGLMVRTTKPGEVLVVFITEKKRPKGAETVIDEIKAAVNKLCGVVCCLPLPDGNPGRTISTLFGSQHVSDSIFELEYRLSPQSFFQVNPDSTELLYGEAVRMTEPAGKRILDAYCGAGTISLLMKKRGAEYVRGLEIVAPAIEDAKLNMQKNGLSGCDFICTAVEDGIENALHDRFDAIVLDPPRKGCDKKVIDAIINSNIDRITYVSCNPATLARDIKLLSQGGFKTEQVRPVDMFPYTSHVETVCLLSKLNAKQHIEINLDMDELDLTDAEKKATYQEIKDYVLEHSGLKVSSLYIAQVKQQCGIIERENYNKPKSEDAKQPGCPPDKEKEIKEALT
ncbi:MAG: 23S rRNA (uracil(1939)-C(5))-methyltransferase RlmD, partial [Clostridia bacterium]|nr:23S rRNA (uracil(1939)-C(5))-methyltransferase RlmD [Clostridia bacterium]